ncbi:Plasmodium variant antigen protein Cir/Yir/Bir, putative, partial [Plasmodium chabaudi adami]
NLITMNYLCTLFKGIDEKISVNLNNSEFNSDQFSSLNNFCPFLDDGKQQKCNNYEEIVISAFITFLALFKSNDAEVDAVEDDKLAEYAILWLCYKLNQNAKNKFLNINEIYNNYIKSIEKYINGLDGVETFNSCMDIINKKQYLMSMDIKIASNIYKAFEKLCKLYTECNEKNNDYPSCSKDASEFVENFEKLNGNSDITGNNSYSQILYTLSTDYNNFKNVWAKKCIQCTDLPTLPKIKMPPGLSIASKLITALSIFAIPVFLGIAYKYSLFGFDKRLKRIHSREKLKKIKKKMNQYI